MANIQKPCCVKSHHIFCIFVNNLTVLLFFWIALINKETTLRKGNDKKKHHRRHRVGAASVASVFNSESLWGAVFSGGVAEEGPHNHLIILVVTWDNYSIISADNLVCDIHWNNQCPDMPGISWAGSAPH